MIIDHLTLIVSEFEAAKRFYQAALAPLGIDLIRDSPTAIGFGKHGNPEVWFEKGEVGQRPLHIAFVAENRQQVNAFHEAALKAGGQDHGAPGIRASYSPTYYAAFVIAPDGHNVEAVCHTSS